MSVSFIVWRNRSTLRKPSSCRKSLKQNVSYEVVSSTPCHERDSKSWSSWWYVLIALLVGNPTPKDHDNHDSLVPFDGQIMCNIYLTGCYDSCERVHVIIKHDHNNKIYALYFLLRRECTKSTELSVYHKLCGPYKQPLTLLILFCYLFLENGIQYRVLGISFKTTLIILNGVLIMNNFYFD